MYKTIILCLILMSGSVTFSQKNTYNFLVGTYTYGSSEGIYSLKFDKSGNELSRKLLIKSDNPSFLAFSEDKKYVYAVNESGTNCAVSAFSFDKITEKLTLINKISLGNAGPCHVSVSKKHIIVSNYGNGTISVLCRQANGSLSGVVQTIVHQPVTNNQNQLGQSHVHQAVFSPNKKWMIVNNLGTDCIYSYQYSEDALSEPLKLIDEKKLRNKCGPRHAVFTKNGRFLYLLNELDASLITFEVENSGKLNNIQESTLIENATLKNGAADIHLSANEKYLYATNRGEANTISCFSVKKNGTISRKYTISTNGNAPRNFAITPDGKFLLVGNQKTDNITIFTRDNATGELISTKQDIKIGAPVCLLFY